MPGNFSEGWCTKACRDYLVQASHFASEETEAQRGCEARWSGTALSTISHHPPWGVRAILKMGEVGEC